MLTLDEAQARLMRAIEPLARTPARLHDAVGRYLSDDVQAKRTQPPFAASAMDGYAIRFDDLPGPWRVTGESAAGLRFPGAVRSGDAVRIFTGAPLPPGADTILVQEDAARDGDRVALCGEGPPARGAHVRPAGLDFAIGDRLLGRGTQLSPSMVGLCASAGYAEVPVHGRPKVALLSTGNELVPAGVAPGVDEIVDANGPMLAALLSRAGAVVIDVGIVRDDRGAIAAAIDRARGADLLVTLGGASVGDHDLVLPVLESRGAKIDFWKVAIKPGKPLLTGRMGGMHVIGLPGNPVSAFVCAQLFVLPAVRRLAGAPAPLPQPLAARTVVELPANGPRRDHLRATLARGGNGWLVTPASRQDSSMLRLLAASDALLVRPENDGMVPAGTFVPVLPLDSAFTDT